MKKILTKAKFKTKPNLQNSAGVTKCTNSRCLICKNHLITGKCFKFENFEFKIKFPLSCTAQNVIYALKCNGCSASYIGETLDFRKRINLHKSHIKNLPHNSLYVSKHIKNCPGNIAKDVNSMFSVMPIYQIRNKCKDTMTHMEQKFIEKFKPVLNK